MRLSFGCTPVESLSAELQPFYGRHRFCGFHSGWILNGFLEFFNCICQISIFRISEHHQFATSALLTERSKIFVEFFHCICQISMFAFSSCSFTTLSELHTLIVFTTNENKLMSWNYENFKSTIQLVQRLMCKQLCEKDITLLLLENEY